MVQIGKVYSSDWYISVQFVQFDAIVHFGKFWAQFGTDWYTNLVHVSTIVYYSLVQLNVIAWYIIFMCY